MGAQSTVFPIKISESWMQLRYLSASLALLYKNVVVEISLARPKALRGSGWAHAITN